MTTGPDRHAAEERFRSIFPHLGAVAAYARRRGSSDADALAAEVMTIAWRRLADVPRDDPRPWLYATARNLVFAERRAASRTTTVREREVFARHPGPTSSIRRSRSRCVRCRRSTGRPCC